MFFLARENPPAISKNRWTSRKFSLLLGSVFYHPLCCSGASLIHADAIPCRILMYKILPNLTEVLTTHYNNCRMQQNYPLHINHFLSLANNIQTTPCILPGGCDLTGELATAGTQKDPLSGTPGVPSRTYMDPHPHRPDPWKPLFSLTNNESS